MTETGDSQHTGKRSPVTVLPPYALLGVLLLLLFIFWTWLTPGNPEQSSKGISPERTMNETISPSSRATSSQITEENNGRLLTTQYAQSPHVIIRGTPISVEIADDAAERTLGLSKRASLPDGAGLLFIFEQEGTWGFWMKDMRFSIDMIWMNQNGRIVHIERSVSPETFPKTYQPPVPARYVLEVNAGVSERFGWKTGDDVLFVGIPQTLKNQ